MSIIKDNLQDILADIKENGTFFAHNHAIYRCMRGDQKSVLLTTFTGMTSKQAYEDKCRFAVSIPYFANIVSSSATIYTYPIQRIASSNQDLVDFYVEKMQLQEVMSSMNQFFVGMKSAETELYQDEERSLLARAIPNDRFHVWTNDPIQPNIPRVFIKFSGMCRSKIVKDKKVERFIMWSKEECVVVDADGTIHDSIPNHFGVVPFNYINRDADELLPMPNVDMLQNTLLVNSIFTDAAVANYWQAHPTKVLIDADVIGLDGKIDVNPNSVLVLNTKVGSTNRPDFKEVASTLDISKSTGFGMLIKTQVWDCADLGENGADTTTAESGVAMAMKSGKLVDNKKVQQMFFKKLEKSFWKTLAIMHNNIVKRNDCSDDTPRKLFDDNFTIDIKFELPSTEVQQAMAMKSGDMSQEDQTSVAADADTSDIAVAAETSSEV